MRQREQGNSSTDACCTLRACRRQQGRGREARRSPPTHCPPPRRPTQKNDGSFYMEWPDFAAWFGECRIVDPRCFDRLSEDRLARVDGAAGAWVAGRSAGGGLDKNPETFAYNPTFELTTADTSSEVRPAHCGTRCAGEVGRGLGGGMVAFCSFHRSSSALGRPG